MSDPINQVHGLPRMPDGTPLVPRRSHFLDEDYQQKCFYGPEQRPDSGVQEVCNPLTSGPDEFPTNPYFPPADWPAAGTLLRIPQVVFLTRKTNPFGGESPAPDPDQPVAISDEDYRLDRIFLEVQSRLTALRPGRTFVKYWGDWFASSNHFDGDPTYFAMIDTMDHLLAPPLSETNYLGTDFLHVFVGFPYLHAHSEIFNATAGAGAGFFPICLDDPYPALGSTFLGTFVSDGFNHPTTDNIVLTLSTTNPDLMVYGDGAGGTLGPVGLTTDIADNPAFVSSLARLEAAFPKFRRYAAWVWAPRLDGAGIDWTVQSWQASTFDPPDDEHYLETLDVSNTHTELISQYLKDTCLPAADFGVQFRGVTTDLNADDLVAAIAEHFGFDPTTGEDLPPA